MSLNLSTLRGFNYQPSYGSTGLEMWTSFNESLISHEIALGKAYFPQFNAVRWWLSFDAWQRNPRTFLEKFERTLQIADRFGIAVMPVLFNRWHDGTMDYGGIYFESIGGGHWKKDETHAHRTYMEQVVGGHAADPRIFSWDLCNEPFGITGRRFPDGMNLEFGWLESLYKYCKMFRAEAPVTVGIHMNDKLDGLKFIEPISDILSIHPYCIPDGPNRTEKADFEKLLDDCVEYAGSVGKALVASETCWGSLDDAARAANVAYHLGELKKRGIGWLAYALHHSICPDLHRLEFGPLGEPGNLAFIEADGTIRPGHEVFNDY